MTQKELTTMVMLMARTRVLRRSFRREKRLLDRRTRDREASLADGWPAITFLNLYLAHLHVLLEGWDDYLCHDDKVYQILKSPYRRRLHGFRNAVFHARPFNESRLIAVYDNHTDICTWADSLLDTIGKFLRREVSRSQISQARLPNTQ